MEIGAGNAIHSVSVVGYLEAPGRCRTSYRMSSLVSWCQPCGRDDGWPHRYRTYLNLGCQLAHLQTLSIRLASNRRYVSDADGGTLDCWIAGPGLENGPAYNAEGVLRYWAGTPGTGSSDVATEMNGTQRYLCGQRLTYTYWARCSWTPQMLPVATWLVAEEGYRSGNRYLPCS